MINQVIICGRVVRDVTIRETESGKKVCDLTLAVKRPFKNFNGEVETDFIKCIVWDTLATSIKTWAVKGNVVAVKARLQVRKQEIDSTNIYYNEVIAERVTYIAKSEKAIEEELTEELTD
jgi:single-strand DNA-binding protein